MNIKYELYLGRQIPNGHVVTTNSFNTFIQQEVLSRFPCITITHAEGIWTGESGNSIVETTNVVTIIATSDDIVKVRKIAAKYKSFFEQEAVLVTKTKIKSELL